jgi:hypothetical protein
MANRAFQARATKRNGDQLTLQSQETDSPILPVAQLQQLHEFRPDLVDFVIEQTTQEAKYRRSHESRVNWFIFIERIFGQLAAILVALAGIGGGIYAGLQGQPWLGGVIASVTIGTLAVAFLRRNQVKTTATATTKK